MELRQQHERARAHWWTHERRRSMLHEAIQVLNVVQGKVATRRRLDERAAEKRRKQRLARDAADAATVAKKAVVAETRRLGGIWQKQDGDSTRRLLEKRSLYNRLQSEKEHRLDAAANKERWRRKDVKNGGVSSRKREFSDDGIPLTAAAAAATFGLTPLVVRDETDELRGIRNEAADYEHRSEEANRAFHKHVRPPASKSPVSTRRSLCGLILAALDCGHRPRSNAGDANANARAISKCLAGRRLAEARIRGGLRGLGPRLADGREAEFRASLLRDDDPAKTIENGRRLAIRPRRAPRNYPTRQLRGVAATSSADAPRGERTAPD